MTLRQAILEATGYLSDEEDLRENARQDAEALLLHVLGAPRTRLFTDAEQALGESELTEYKSLVDRRLRGEPIQYIVGRQEFYGLPFRVTPAVLIPRPETELLVEAVLQRLPNDRALQVVDVGTGSGAIAIAIAHHLPLATVTALDISEAALALAEENAERLGLAGRIRFLRSDLLAAVIGEASFDAVLSNPPYIPASDRESLHRQVREHEPATALFADEDGLSIYRRLIPQAFAALKPGALLAMEMGYGQRVEVEALLRGWAQVEFLNDLQNVPRVALAHKT